MTKQHFKVTAVLTEIGHCPHLLTVIRLSQYKGLLIQKNMFFIFKQKVK